MILNIFRIMIRNILLKIKFKIGQMFTKQIIRVYFLKWIILDEYNLNLLYLYTSTISSHIKRQLELRILNTMITSKTLQEYSYRP